jgi:photosystem II stability/assembly factor-like uncharacterized protein
MNKYSDLPRSSRHLSTVLKALQLVAASLLCGPVSGWADAPPTVLTAPAIVTPKAVGAEMLAVARAGSRLVAVGERGIVLVSDDSGKTWVQAQTPVRVSLTAVQFVDDKSGWAVGHGGVVLRSTDAGATWSKQLDGIQAAGLILRQLERQAEAAGADSAKVQRDLADARRLVADGPDKPFLDVYFLDRSNGYVVGAYNLIFRTRDGGRNWEPWQQHLDNPKAHHLYGIRSAGSSIFIVGEQGLLLRSTDDGATFTQLSSPYKGTFFGIVAAKDDALLVYGLRGNVFRSTNLGDSWEKVETALSASISAAVSLSNHGVLLATQSGDLLLSRDGGATFKSVAHKTQWPIAGMVESEASELIIAGPAGVRKIPSSKGM